MLTSLVSLPKIEAKENSVQPKQLFERDGRCVQSLTDHSPQRTNLRLLTITTS